MLNILLNIWTAEPVHISKLNLSEAWVLEPRQKKYQKVFGKFGGSVLILGSTCQQDLTLCSVLMSGIQQLGDRRWQFFSELEEMSWKTQSQTSLLFSSNHCNRWKGSAWAERQHCLVSDGSRDSDPIDGITEVFGLVQITRKWFKLWQSFS